MEALQPEAASVSGGMTAPKTAERLPFTATKREHVAALLTFPLAYLYILFFWGDLPRSWLLAAFSLGFFALTEYLHGGRPRPRESWVWLGCAAACLTAYLLHRGRAFDPDGCGLAALFLHIFAVWWALSRSHALLAGESGRLLPLDALNDFAAYPFGNFLLWPQTLLHALPRRERRADAEEIDVGAALWSLFVAAAALGLLVLSARLLTDADEGFAALLAGLMERLRFDWDGHVLREFLLRFALSLPVGAYLYGLLGGTLRQRRAALDRRAESVERQMEALRGVPERVWTVLLSLFCLLYAAFFAVQGRYLFGAFLGALPEGFSVAEYARQGFFELCKVMGVNFALLYLAWRTSKSGLRQRRALWGASLALLAESLLLSAVALSKLGLYIGHYGFTPRRLQSTWLVCVLAFGCLCAARWLLWEKKSFRAWMIFGAVTLSLLCLY